MEAPIGKSSSPLGEGGKATCNYPRVLGGCRPLSANRISQRIEFQFHCQNTRTCGSRFGNRLADHGESWKQLSWPVMGHGGSWKHLSASPPMEALIGPWGIMEAPIMTCLLSFVSEHRWRHKFGYTPFPPTPSRYTLATQRGPWQKHVSQGGFLIMLR